MGSPCIFGPECRQLGEKGKDRECKVHHNPVGKGGRVLLHGCHDLMGARPRVDLPELEGLRSWVPGDCWMALRWVL